MMQQALSQGTCSRPLAPLVERPRCTARAPTHSVRTRRETRAHDSTADGVLALQAADTLDSQPLAGSESLAQRSTVRAATPAEPESEQEAARLQLEQRVGNAIDRQELMDYVQNEHTVPLQPSELVYVLNQLAKLCDAKAMTYRARMSVKAFIGELLQQYPKHLKQLDGYELVVLLTALARTRYQPSTEFLDSYFKASMPHLTSYGPGYMYMLLRSLTRLGSATHGSYLQLWELKAVPSFRDWMEALMEVSRAKVRAYRGDELVRTLAALSQLRWRPSAEWTAAYVTALKSHLEFLDPRLLSQALLALSTLTKAPQEPGLMTAMISQLSTKLPMFDDRDLASTAKALLLVEKMVSGDFFSDFMIDVAQKSHTFSTASLSHLLDAFACLVTSRKLCSTPAGAFTQPPPAAHYPAWNDPETDPETDSSRPPEIVLEPPVGQGMAGAAAQSAAGSSGGAAQGGLQGAGVEGPRAPSRKSASTQGGPPVAMEYRPLSVSLNGAQDRPGAVTGRPRVAQSPSVGADRHAAHWRPALPAASPAWLLLMQSRVAALLPHMSVDQAAMSLCGLATLGLPLDRRMVDNFFMMSLPKLKEAKSTRTYINIAKAISLSQYQPASPAGVAAFTDWFNELVRLMPRRKYSPSMVCDMVAALSGLPLRVPEKALSILLANTRRNRPSALRQVSPRRLALLAASLRRLGYRPDFGFFHSFAQGIRFHISNIEAQELTAVLVALAALSPPTLAIDQLWMSDIQAIVQCRLDRFDGPCLASTLAALVALGSDPLRAGPAGPGLPSVRLVVGMLERLAEVQRSLQPQHAASVLWACASLMQHYGPDSVTISQPRKQVNTWEGPPAALLSALVACAESGATSLPPPLVADVCWALNVLGEPVPPSIAAVHEQTRIVTQGQAGDGAGCEGDGAGMEQGSSAAPYSGHGEGLQAEDQDGGFVQLPSHVVETGGGEDGRWARVDAHVTDAHVQDAHVTLQSGAAFQVQQGVARRQAGQSMVEGAAPAADDSSWVLPGQGHTEAGGHRHKVAQSTLGVPV